VPSLASPEQRHSQTAQIAPLAKESTELVPSRELYSEMGPPTVLNRVLGTLVLLTL
jgi:hypothetical protein